MIYANFVELHSLMFHAKFQNQKAFWFWRRRFLKVFAIYSHGSHLGHVTLIIYINFHSLFLRMLQIKFVFDWPSGFREEASPRERPDNPLGPKYFHKHKSSVHLLISSKFSAIKCQGLDLYKLCRAPFPDASCQVSKSQAFRF